MTALIIGLVMATATAAAEQQPPPAGSPAATGQAAPQPPSTSSGQGKAAQPPATAPSASSGQAGQQPPAEAPEPQGYTYNPEGRRDPFVSLVRRGTDSQRAGSLGSRPAGLSGLTTAEVTLTGTMQSRSGFVGMLRGADNKTYIVRPGDKLLDGTVQTITVNTMVILQQVNDPLSLEKQREVRKMLRQTDEVK